MSKSWSNVKEWTDDIPMNFLPFFVWCTAKNIGIDHIFEENHFNGIYQEFIDTMDLNYSNEFKGWCYDQYIHYYECNH